METQSCSGGDGGGGDVGTSTGCKGNRTQGDSYAQVQIQRLCSFKMRDSHIIY